MTSQASDKWIKDRLDSLQSELFEYSTQNQMGFEDVALSLREVRAQLADSRRENAALRERLSQHQAAVGSSLSELRQSLTAPKQIIRDENGLISGVRIANEGESN